MTGLVLGVEARAYNATIRSERLKRGLTQREVDELAGVTHGTTGRLETLRDPRVGERGLRVLRVLGLDESASPEWLQGLDLYGAKRVERSVAAELFAQPERLMLESPLSVGDPSWAVEDDEELSFASTLLGLLDERERLVVLNLFSDDPEPDTSMARLLNTDVGTLHGIENRAMSRLRGNAERVFGRPVEV